MNQAWWNENGIFVIVGTVCTVAMIMSLIAMYFGIKEAAEKERKEKAAQDEFLNSEFANRLFPKPLYLFNVKLTPDTMFYQSGSSQFLAESYFSSIQNYDFFIDGQLMRSFPKSATVQRMSGPYNSVREIYCDPYVPQELKRICYTSYQETKK